MAPRVERPVPDELDGARLDVALAQLGAFSRAWAQQLVRDGEVRLDGGPVRASTRVRAGQSIAFSVRPRPPLRAAPEAMALDIVWEDEDLVVVNKPRGLVVHPAPGHPDGTLVNALLHHVGSLPGAEPVRPGIVHRIDRDTSGLLVVAKSERALAPLQQMVASHRLHRGYDALVHGQPPVDAGDVALPIGRHPQDRKRLWVVAGGREARTHFRVAARLGRISLLRLRLETGRTHQIRVHLAYMGWPVVGDPLYGPERRRGDGQLLHAARLAFEHPVTGAAIRLQAPWPQDMVDCFLRHGGDPRLLAGGRSAGDAIEEDP